VWRLFAVWCARQVQHLMTDPRSIAALDVAERHANGMATDEELHDAWAAAGDAKWGARDARAAAVAGARAAAWAAEAAARAAWAAAWAAEAAARAAWAAAWAAEAAAGAAWAAAWAAEAAAGDGAEAGEWDAAFDAQAAEFLRIVGGE
jgi:hypothetical protein